jgi:hypothetical protein
MCGLERLVVIFLFLFVAFFLGRREKPTTPQRTSTAPLPLFHPHAPLRYPQRTNQHGVAVVHRTLAATASGIVAATRAAAATASALADYYSNNDNFCHLQRVCSQQQQQQQQREKHHTGGSPTTGHVRGVSRRQL